MAYHTIVILILLFAEWTHALSLNQTLLIEMFEYYKLIKTQKVKNVFLQCDRKNYAPEDPYSPETIHVGFGSTLSPFILQVFILENLKENLKEGMKALDIGSSCGYLTMLMALMVGRTGHAVGVEHIPELVENAKENVKKDNHTSQLEAGQIRFIAGDGRLGYPELGPYDAIHIGAMVRHIPITLIQQLNYGGKMLVPLLTTKGKIEYHEMIAVEKLMDGTIRETEIREGMFAGRLCHYEPLCDKDKQLSEPFVSDTYFVEGW